MKGYNMRSDWDIEWAEQDAHDARMATTAKHDADRTALRRIYALLLEASADRTLTATEHLIMAELTALDVTSY